MADKQSGNEVEKGIMKTSARSEKEEEKAKEEEEDPEIEDYIQRLEQRKA